MDTNSKTEKWKPIAGYEGLYDVSNTGRVRSYHTLGQKRRPTSRRKPLTSGACRIMTPVATSQGYLKVVLSKCNTATEYYISKLVLDAFAGKPIVYFIDGDITNIKESNLRWGSRSEAKQRNKALNSQIAS
jgi:hypothetical protein